MWNGGGRMKGVKDLNGKKQAFVLSGWKTDYNSEDELRNAQRID